MLLLQLLCFLIVGFLLRQLLVLLVLLLLQLLPLLVLLRGQLVLLLLIFLVEPGVPSVGSGSARGRRKFFRVNRRVGVTGVFRAAIIKFSRPRSRSDRRLAMVGGSAQRRILEEVSPYRAARRDNGNTAAAWALRLARAATSSIRPRLWKCLRTTARAVRPSRLRNARNSARC